MSNLTDFFPQSSGSSSSKNAAILLVGGGGGGGAGAVCICNTPCPEVSGTNDICTGFGGGGGGVYVGHLNITEGCTYPVVVGAGGACGCLKPACAGEPGGAGSPGGLSRFGSFVVGGGGGAGTLCVTGGGAGRTGVECYQGQTTKYVANKVGANFGSFGKGKVSGCGPSYEIPYCLWGEPTCTASYKSFDEHGLNLGVNVDITEFHVYDEASAGGGFMGVYMGCAPPSPYETFARNYSVGQGDFVNVTSDCWCFGWELVPNFYGLAVIPCDTCDSSSKERIVYCCSPTCCYPGRPDGGPNSSFSPGCAACTSCMVACGKWIASNWTLGNSRNQHMHGYCQTTNSWPSMQFSNCLIPPVANTGSGGFNQRCPGTCPRNNQFTPPTGPSKWDLCHSCYGLSATGDAGVVYVVYDCSLGAATSTPGGVDCTPVTGPQGYRSYRYTSSGSFTL